jgi:hypothetical protein
MSGDVVTAYAVTRVKAVKRRSGWTGREAHNRLVTATGINLWIPDFGEYGYESGPPKGRQKSLDGRMIPRKALDSELPHGQIAESSLRPQTPETMNSGQPQQRSMGISPN